MFKNIREYFDIFKGICNKKLFNEKYGNYVPSLIHKLIADSYYSSEPLDLNLN